MNSWTITLPAELAEFVNEQLACKAWDSVDLLFAAAVAALQSNLEWEDSLDQDQLREQLQHAVDQADRGEMVDGPKFMAQLRERIKAHAGA
jgi:hypothetical protein